MKVCLPNTVNPRISLAKNVHVLQVKSYNVWLLACADKNADECEDLIVYEESKVLTSGESSRGTKSIPSHNKTELWKTTII